MTSKNNSILEPGSTLFGYKGIEFLGEGGWSYVYKAQHPELPLSVAVKQLKPELVKHKNALERFLREANIVARLRHPNVVTIYDLKQDDDANQYYIITELAEKGTLADLLQEYPEGLPIDDTLRLAMGICSGLEVTHRKKITHLDIKPSNVLLFEDERGRDLPKLCDFGIAKATGITSMDISADDTESLRIYGTFYYMSPEQLDEKLQVDHRSDLYSLGIMLYQLLTGTVPFTGEVQDIVEAHTWLSPKPPRELRPDIPQVLDQIIVRALRKDREKRYQSAADMHEALRSVRDASIRKEQQAQLRAHLRLGQQFIAAAKWTEAIKVLTKASRLEPENEQVVEELHKARVEQKLEGLSDLADQCLKEEKWEKARGYLLDIMALAPSYADGKAREQLEQATRELERERSQSDLMAQYRAGMGYFQNQQWTLAIEQLEQVVAQEPEFEDAVDRLKEARQYMDAKRSFEQAQRHIEQGEWEEATQFLEQVQLLTSHIDVTMHLEFARDNWERAKARAKEKQQLTQWYDEGMVQFEQGNLQEARTHFERVHECWPEYPGVADRLKEIERETCLNQLFEQESEHEEAGEWVTAIDVCRRILEVDPFNREASRCIVRVHRRHDREERRIKRQERSGSVRMIEHVAISLVLGVLGAFLIVDLDVFPPLKERLVPSMILLLVGLASLSFILIQWLAAQRTREDERSIEE